MAPSEFGAVCAAALAAVVLFSLPTEAAVIVDADANGHRTPRFPEDPRNTYRVLLDPLPAEALEPRDSMQHLGLLQATFGGWRFEVGDPAPGVFNIVHYDVDVDRRLPFAFQVDYVPGQDAGVPAPGTSLRWIQLVDTNRPRPPGPRPRPYLDGPPGDGVPFYFTDPDNFTNLPGGVALRFVDKPSRRLATAFVDWEGLLFLTSWNEVGPNFRPPLQPRVTFHDGLRWGFEIVCVGPGRGPNVLGGVGGDQQIDDSGTGLPFCLNQVPEPPPAGVAGLALALAGALRALMRLRGRNPGRVRQKR